MKPTKSFILGTFLALPFMAVWFYLLNPPQCPAGYTQAQVDASRCVIGANIGGVPFFILSAAVTWVIAIALVRFVSKRIKR